MKTGKLIRVLSVILIFALIVQIFPMTAFAESLNDGYVPDETLLEETAENTDETEVSENENSEEIPPEIVSEDVSKREENVKHFRLSNGENIAVMYEEPIHYLNDNNEWVDYDNSFDEIPAVSEDEGEADADEIDYVSRTLTLRLIRLKK